MPFGADPDGLAPSLSTPDGSECENDESASGWKRLHSARKLRALRRERHRPRSRSALTVAAKPEPKDEAKDEPKFGARESFLDALRKFIPTDEPKPKA